MKKIISMLFVICLALSVNVTTFASDTIYVTLDGNYIEFDVKPQIINGRTMVPIRAIFEKMGATVEWDSSTSSAICKKGDIVVKMTVDSMDMYINNQVTKMDISPVVIDGRTLAPARYVAEAFGADVQWSQKNNTVVICSKDVYAYVDYPDIPDLGRCYNIPVSKETKENGIKLLTYLYPDMSNDDYYSYLYDNSALVLGGYVEEIAETTDDMVLINYTKRGETEPRYCVGVGYMEDGSMAFVVAIPLEETAEVTENKVTLYSLDGRTIEVLESEVPAYLNVGWYETKPLRNSSDVENYLQEKYDGFSYVVTKTDGLDTLQEKNTVSITRISADWSSPSEIEVTIWCDYKLLSVSLELYSKEDLSGYMAAKEYMKTIADDLMQKLPNVEIKNVEFYYGYYRYPTIREDWNSVDLCGWCTKNGKFEWNPTSTEKVYNVN